MKKYYERKDSKIFLLFVSFQTNIGNIGFFLLDDYTFTLHTK